MELHAAPRPVGQCSSPGSRDRCSRFLPENQRLKSLLR